MKIPTKKVIDNTENLVEIICVTCNSIYKLYSTIKNSEQKIGSCGNCHHVYTKESPLKIRTGRVQKIKEREEKTKKINEGKK